MIVKKKRGTVVTAYQLKKENPQIKKLIAEGKIRPLENGTFAVMSREATEGQIAKEGDYIKIDSGGYPYPNSREFFEANHVRTESGEYEQVPRELQAWRPQEGITEEFRFLVDHKGLVYDPSSETECFRAPLWGDIETAGRDAIVVYYQVDRDALGNITDISFNFVVRDEFEKTYDVIRE